MQDGTVVWFNDASGTGKILGDDGAMVSVSCESLRGGCKTLAQGLRVCFEAIKHEAYFVVPVLTHAKAEAAAV